MQKTSSCLIVPAEGGKISFQPGMISGVLAKHWQVYGQTEMWKSWINAPFVQLLSSLLNSEKTKGSPDHACVFRGDFSCTTVLVRLKLCMK